MMIKRVFTEKKLALLCVLVSVFFCFMLFFSINKEPVITHATAWDGSIAQAFSGGSGTETDPFLISSAGELAYFSQTVNNQYTYCLCDLCGECIETSISEDCECTECPKLTYNRANYKLTDNIELNDVWDFDDPPETLNEWIPAGTASIAFRGSFDGNGKEISGIYINASSAYAGLFGYIYQATIVNLTVMHSFVSNDAEITSCTGGFAGYAELSLITGCSFSGRVSGERYTGGITGELRNGSLISECHNEGVIISSRTVGGLTGLLISSSLEKSSNSGKIQGGNPNYSGGIAGECSSNSVITDCNNTGEITDGGRTGGITGTTHTRSRIERCYNEGTIDGGVSGGITGYLTSSSIDNCYNTGTVAGTGSIGGLAGEAISSSVISFGYNIGSITGTSANTGGLVGNLTQSSIANSFNSGSVTGAQRCGGLASYVYTNSVITNSYNTGTVQGGAESSGLAGGLIARSTSSARLENCYNIGSVTGYKSAGIVTEPYSLVVINSYYLKDSAPDNGTDIPLEAEEMQSKEFASSLNAGGFVQHSAANSGYPMILLFDSESADIEEFYNGSAVYSFDVGSECILGEKYILEDTPYEYSLDVIFSPDTGSDITYNGISNMDFIYVKQSGNYSFDIFLSVEDVYEHLITLPEINIKIIPAAITIKINDIDVKYGDAWEFSYTIIEGTVYAGDDLNFKLISDITGFVGIFNIYGNYENDNYDVEIINGKCVIYYANKINLHSLLIEAQNLTESDYTAESFKILTDALETSLDVLSDEYIKQAGVDQAYNTLLGAIHSLEKIQTTNPSENDNVNLDMNALIALIGIAMLNDENAFTSESYAVLSEALETALNMITNKQTVQEEIDTAYSTLLAALRGLEQTGGNNEPFLFWILIPILVILILEIAILFVIAIVLKAKSNRSR